MSIHTLEQLYGELKSRTKVAADITSEDITGQDPGSMPGSENDKKVPEEMKTPDPEVKDETVGGAENYSAEGASPGSDNPKLEPQLLEADEPVLEPEKKPLDSTDVDAKTAAAGNNLVDFILKAQKKELEAKKAAAPAPAKKEAAPAPAKKAAAPAPAKKEAAPTDDIVLTNSVMAKIAAVVLSRQEGRELVQRFLAEAAGEDFAKQAMDTMGLVGRQANEMSEFEKGAQDAAAMLGDMEEAQGAQDAEQALADAGDAEEAAGAADAEAALAGAGAGDEGAALGGGEEAAGEDEGFTDEEVLEAIQEMVEDGEITEDQAAQLLEGADVSEEESGDAPVSEDDIAEAIVEGIQSGEISPEVAQELVAELSGETSPEEAQELASDVDEAEPAAEEPAAEEPAAEEPAAEEPAAEEPAPEEAKEASVKKAAARTIVKTLVQAIQEKQAAAKKAKKAPAPAKKPVKK